MADHMTQPNGAAVHHAEAHGPSVQVYLVVFAALCVFTLLSFLVNAILGIVSHTGVAISLAVAVCKADLVGMFFMHLKFDWFKLYFLIVPVGILCVLMMIVLMPDGVFGWPHDVESSSPQAAQKK